MIKVQKDKMDYRKIADDLRQYKVETGFGGYTPSVCIRGAVAIENLMKEKTMIK